MFKNKNYVYGNNDLSVPVNLNFSEFILKKLLEKRDKIAMINGATHETITFQEIAQRAMNFAVSLSRIGVRKGDVIVICSENQHDFICAAIGIFCVGAVLTSLNVGYTKDEFKHIMNISKPKFAIFSQDTYKMHRYKLKATPSIKKVILYGNVKQQDTLLYNEMAIAGPNGMLADNVKYEEFQAVDVHGQTDTMIILYSSGTTGLPKGVMLTHLNSLAICCAHLIYEEQVTLTIAPWYHVLGLMGCIKLLVNGWTSIFLPKFDIKLYLDTIERYKATEIIVVPPVLVALTKFESTHDVSSIRSIFCGAAPLHKDTLADVRKRFPNAPTVFQGYGMTESSYGILKDTGDAEKAKPGGVGYIIDATIAKVVNTETREALGPNEHGEICIKGPTIMKGYIGKDRSDFDEEGFYKTGDIGYYDEDRYFFIVDRLKELIKYKGYQVAPAEIEAVLLQHDAVRDAGVVGIENKEAGEVPMAFVVLQPGRIVSEVELKELVGKKLSNPKHLRGGVRFVNEIPKNPSGKILRRQLRVMAKL